MPLIDILSTTRYASDYWNLFLRNVLLAPVQQSFLYNLNKSISILFKGIMTRPFYLDKLQSRSIRLEKRPNTVWGYNPVLAAVNNQDLGRGRLCQDPFYQFRVCHGRGHTLSRSKVQEPSFPPFPNRRPLKAKYIRCR